MNSDGLPKNADRAQTSNALESTAVGAESVDVAHVGDMQDQGAVLVTRLLQNVLTPEETRALFQSVYGRTEFEKHCAIKQWAKKKSAPPERILAELRAFAKAKIRGFERGAIRHYHRTSMEHLSVIATDGRFLSRTNVKKLHPELPLSGWSSSDDVMFTRDVLDRDGKIAIPGLSNNEVVGASGRGVIFVMRDTMMDHDDYDASRNYPTVSDMPIAKHCECILANTRADLETAVSLLKGTPLESVPVMLRSTWESARKN